MEEIRSGACKFDTRRGRSDLNGGYTLQNRVLKPHQMNCQSRQALQKTVEQRVSIHQQDDWRILLSDQIADYFYDRIHTKSACLKKLPGMFLVLKNLWGLPVYLVYDNAVIGCPGCCHLYLPAFHSVYSMGLHPIHVILWHRKQGRPHHKYMMQ